MPRCKAGGTRTASGMSTVSHFVDGGPEFTASFWPLPSLVSVFIIDVFFYRQGAWLNLIFNAVIDHPEQFCHVFHGIAAAHKRRSMTFQMTRLPTLFSVPLTLLLTSSAPTCQRSHPTSGGSLYRRDDVNLRLLAPDVERVRVSRRPPRRRRHCCLHTQCPVVST